MTTTPSTPKAFPARLTARSRSCGTAGVFGSDRRYCYLLLLLLALAASPAAIGEVFSLSYGAGAGGHIQTTYPQGSYDAGTLMVFNGVADSGYAFDHWSTTGSSVANKTNAQISFELTANTTLAASFKLAAPTVTHILPPNGTTAGGTAVTIVGTGFTGVTGVTIGGIAATGVTVINSTMLNAIAPAHAAGVGDVAVSATGGIGTGTGLYTYGALPVPAGATWTNQTTGTSASGQSWASIAASADGTKLVATGNDPNASGIWTSVDSGVTWTRTSAPNGTWFGVASSADGTKLAAANSGSSANNYIWTSADSGATWTQQTASGAAGWKAIASSADGRKLAAVVNGGGISTSTDSGVTWTVQTNAGTRGWRSIASSADGSKLAAVVNSGNIFTSTDFGVTWTTQSSAGSHSWNSIASSADGSKLAAVYSELVISPPAPPSLGGHIFTSTDSGATWTDQFSSGSHAWSSVASSADGSELAALISNGDVFTSTDGGATWTDRTSAGSRNWSAIASSADGSKLAAAVTGGDIFTSMYVPSPTVTGIAPPSGSTAGGMSVTITGTDFVAGATVTIGGTAATNVSVTNATTITCTTPAGTAGPASVLVTTTGGTNAANTLYTYELPLPVLVSTSPANNAIGVAPDTSIVLTFDKNIDLGSGQIQLVDVTDGSDTRIFPLPSTLFFSAYVEGSGSNQAIAIYNPRGTPQTVSGSVRIYQNGFSFVASQLPISHTFAAHEVYVVANNSAGAGLLALANLTWPGLSGVSGNDVIELYLGGATVDAIGKIGQNPVGGGWGSGLTSTLDHTLHRKASITTGDTNPNDAFDPSAEWDGYSIDTITGIDSHTMTRPYAVSGATLTLMPTSNLVVGHTYSVQYVSGVIVDTSANSAAALTAGQANFTVGSTPAAPTVSAISPTSGSTAGGTSVTITGTDFTGATGVSVGGAAATGVTVVSATSITCTTPPGTAGMASVVVTTPGGTNEPNTLFTYAAPAPTVTAISPSSGSMAGGTIVTITGTDFTGATGVSVGGAAATGVTVLSATSITCTTPPGTAGMASVVVTTPGGTNEPNTLFTYAAPAPTVTAISPTSGSTAGGTSVTITGTNFTGATGVTIGGTAATGVTVVSATSITCTTPAGPAGLASVVVTTSGGSNEANALYTYVAPLPATHWKGQSNSTWSGENWASDAFGTATTATPTSTSTITFSTIGAGNQSATALTENTTIGGLNVLDFSPVGIAGGKTLTISNSLYVRSSAILTVNGTGTVVSAGSDVAVADSSGDNATLNISGGAQVTGASVFVAGAQATGILNVDGPGSKLTITNGLVVDQGGNGTLSITNGGVVSNADGHLAQFADDLATVTVDGTDSKWTNTGLLYVGEDGPATLTISNGGSLTVGGGSGILTLGSGAGSSGTLNIGSATTAGTSGSLAAASVNGGSGTALVNFNQTDAITFAPTISGSTSVSQLGSGTTVLSADCAYTGDTTVSAGALYINGNNRDPMDQNATTSNVVVTGGTLGGNGTIGGNITVKSGGTIAAGADATSIGTLSQPRGSTSLQDGSTARFKIGGKDSYDQLSVITVAVTGKVTLDLQLTGGYTGAVDDTFQIILHVFGMLDPANFTVTSNLGSEFQWDLSQLAVAGAVKIVAGAPPAPTVTAINPTSGTTSGGTAVTITGTHFTGATGVTIGGAAATGVTVVNATTITCTTPTGSAGTASVLVTTAAGTNEGNTLFTYVAPEKPAITFNYGIPRLNYTTGLLEHTAHITNTAAKPIGGVRLTVTNLPKGCAMYNATDKGSPPSIVVYKTLAAGAALDVLVQYYSSTRTIPGWKPSYTLDAIQPITIKGENSLPAMGGSYGYKVNANSPWKVSLSQKWAVVTPNSGTGGGTFTVKVQPFTKVKPATRSLLIKIPGADDFLLTQNGVEKPVFGPVEVTYKAIVSNYFDLFIPVANGPATLSATGLPPGGTVIPAYDKEGLFTSAYLSFTPTQGGEYHVTVNARNLAGAALVPATFTISVASLPKGVVGKFTGYVARSLSVYVGPNANVGARIDMTTESTGAFTGKITEGVTTKPFDGHLQTFVDTPNEAGISIPIAGTPLQLMLDLNAANDEALGSLYPSGSMESAEVRMFRNVWTKNTGPGSNPATAFSGKAHNFRIRNPTAAGGPQGFGYGSFTVNADTGNLVVTGKLADGSALFYSTFIAKNGGITVYQPLYGNRGSFLGSIGVDAKGNTDVTDNGVSGGKYLNWVKPATTTGADTVYRDGFNLDEIDLEGGAYLPPAKGQLVLGLAPTPPGKANTSIDFNKGGLSAPFSQGLRIANPSANGVTNTATPLLPNANTVAINIESATGLFTGSFKLSAPGSVRYAPFNGLICTTQKGTSGFGFFLLPQGTSATAAKLSGSVAIEDE